MRTDTRAAERRDRATETGTVALRGGMRDGTMVTAGATTVATGTCSMTDVDLAAMTEGTVIVTVAMEDAETLRTRRATTTT